MSYVKKWKPGRPIKSVSEAVNLIWNKKRFVFYRHKPCHYGWAASWSLFTIFRAINNGFLFTAKENKKCPKN